MTAGYDASQIASEPVYFVRLLIGDTAAASNGWQLQDEEIAAFLAMRPNPYGAAADCLRMLANRYSVQPDTVQGDLRTLYSSRAKAYANRAAEMEQKAVSHSGAMPFSGGLSVSDKDANDADTNRVQPQFRIGMDDADFRHDRAGEF